MSNKPHNILVVDPDERSYKTFESILGAKNGLVFVPNEKTALVLPDSQPIDIAFISHAFNGINGIMLLESFKQRHPSIPVILIAEQPKVDEVISAFRSGARELIVKPIDANELVAVTQKISGFLSNNKPWRRWFFPAKKEAQSNKPEKNKKRHSKKILKKFKKTENFSVTELDDFQMNEIIALTEDSNNQLIADALFETPRPDKGTHLIAQIEEAHPLVEGFFFGSFRVLVNNQPIENWPSKKGKSIFAYLLLNHKKKIFRDVLMDLLWRKSDPDSARNCLNVTIHGLRRVLQDIDPKTEYILFKDERYYVNPEVEIRLDVDAFRSIWRKAQSIEYMKDSSVAISEYECAAEMYNGDFLEDEIYDGWSSFDRENLKEIYLVILDKISENFMNQNNYQKAIWVCEKILEKDNCREDIYRRLMECYYHTGHRARAIKIFRKCTKILKAELEVEPSLSTLELYRKIKKT